MHKTILNLSAAVLLLSGCSAVDRLSNVGEVPEQSRIENPVMRPGYQPVSLPMPAQRDNGHQANSLWTIGSQKTFFEDQRANQIGDILTVLIDISDQANLKDETSRSRAATENAGIPHVLGFEQYLQKVLPDAASATNLLDADADSSNKGKGEIKRNEDISMKVAAVVSEILPNGNMVIHGRQEVRVNYENRILQISGVIRPQDININNAITYDKVAEARISYGGKGQITDVQQPRYGQQVFDILSPF